MADLPVRMESMPDFAPLIARRKASNPPGKQYELWVIEEDGKKYYLHGTYETPDVMLKAAEIVIRSRVFDDDVMDLFDR